MAQPTETPNRATATRPARSSKRVARKAPLGWLPWLLLLLLALALLAGLLLVKLASRNDDDTSSTRSQTATSQPAAGAAALTAGSVDLLGRSGGAYGDLNGSQVTGTATVQSVVADEGFWAGTSSSRRVFVYLTSQARQSSGESGFQVKAGQTLSVAGDVARGDAAFAQRVGVTDSEGQAQLVRQGAYVNATRVALS